ncbi:Hypothetical protein CINCED_3A018900 [Cinara cedri]|uniref:Uncharacterized protein n=1 Tax=Cinara cedri TaxID=506608 RepID=A0A5E4M6G8_9HEMI|nr:Hypothetical protein CINCED_3A018900 [Cinara cedri]
MSFFRLRCTLGENQIDPFGPIFLNHNPVHKCFGQKKKIKKKSISGGNTGRGKPVLPVPPHDQCRAARGAEQPAAATAAERRRRRRRRRRRTTASAAAAAAAVETQRFHVRRARGFVGPSSTARPRPQQFVVGSRKQRRGRGRRKTNNVYTYNARALSLSLLLLLLDAIITRVSRGEVAKWRPAEYTYLRYNDIVTMPTTHRRPRGHVPIPRAPFSRRRSYRRAPPVVVVDAAAESRVSFIRPPRSTVAATVFLARDRRDNHQFSSVNTPGARFTAETALLRPSGGRIINITAARTRCNNTENPAGRAHVHGFSTVSTSYSAGMVTSSTGRAKTATTMQDTTFTLGKGRRSARIVQFLVFALVAIGAGTRPAESAAVVNNDNHKQQLLDSKVPSTISYGGCDDGRVINCRTLPLFNYTDLTPPPVGADAAADILQDDNCPYKNLERHLRCVDVFTRRCMTVDQRKAFYLLYKVPTLDMQELCTEGGPYREEYLKHATCLRTVHNEYIQCGRRHQNELAALMAEHDHQHHGGSSPANDGTPFAGPEQITQNLGHLCGSFRGHLNCVHGIVRANCGEQTDAFASQFLSQIAASLLNVCDKYVSPADGDVSRSPSSTSAAPTSGADTGLEVFTVTAAMVILATASRRW